MALRDYYRCKRCDAKIAYGPDRSEEDWEPFLLCRWCIVHVESALKEAIDRMQMVSQIPETGFVPMCDAAMAYARSAISKVQS